MATRNKTGFRGQPEWRRAGQYGGRFSDRFDGARRERHRPGVLLRHQPAAKRLTRQQWRLMAASAFRLRGTPTEGLPCWPRQATMCLASGAASRCDTDHGTKLVPALPAADHRADAARPGRPARPRAGPRGPGHPARPAGGPGLEAGWSPARAATDPGSVYLSERPDVGPCPLRSAMAWRPVRACAGQRPRARRSGTRARSSHGRHTRPG